MITLYSANEVDFSHDGLGILNNVSSCVINRELNGEWSLDLEIDISDRKAHRLGEFKILKAPTPSGFQLFRIREIEKNLDTISVYATHIFFDLADNYILDTNIVGKTRGEAIKHVLNNTNYGHRFTHVNEDKTDINNCRIVRKNVVESLIGSDSNTIISRFGGEIDIDNFNIYSYDQIGKYTNFSIEYSKNLSGITETIDMTDVATRIIPIGFDELMLPEIFVDSDNINDYHAPLVKKVEFNDIKIITADEAETPDQIVTEAQAQEQLRVAVRDMYSKGVQFATVNYTINFIDLKNTLEYKNYKFLHSINIGDIVNVTHRDLNIVNLECRLSKYSYNALTNEFESVSVGTDVKRLSSDISKINDNLNSSKNNILSKVNGVTGGVDSLNNKVNDVTNDVNSLDNKVNNLDTTVDNRLNVVGNNINTVANRVTVVENDITTIKANINTIEQNIETLDKKVDTKTSKDDVEQIIDNRTDLLRKIHTEEFTTIKDAELTITLPNEFKGRNFTAFVSVTDTLVNNDHTLVGFNLKVERTDQAAGEVVIVGNKTELDNNNAPVIGEIKGNLMVVAY